MNGRIRAVVGILSCLPFAIGPSPLLAAEVAAPSEQNIGNALRPAPKGLGTKQGLPTLGTLPGTNENPNLQGASLPRSSSTPAGLEMRGPASPRRRTTSTPISTELRPSIALNTIQFTFDSAQLTPGSSETLHNLGLALNRELADQRAFLIEGHTDAAGNRQYNTILSRRRAQAVKDYLVREAGVSSSRLQTVGKGPSEPANRADPYAAENRRVVIVNLGS
jgi:outer membrane protein OmpA-like peptidoglycan-associated protein